MNGAASGTQGRLELRVNTALAIGHARPIVWQVGVGYRPDEPATAVLVALDAALAQLRAQLEIDIRESLR